MLRWRHIHRRTQRRNADIQFTKEIEENGKIPFVDCLVTRDNNKLQTTNDYLQQPTRTDRLLDQSSYNLTSHKATTIRTLTRRAQLVCDSPDSLQDETDDLKNVFSKKNYNTDFVRRNTHSNTDSNTQSNVNSGVGYNSDYTALQRHLWNYITYITTLQYKCCAQTNNHFTATAC